MRAYVRTYVGKSLSRPTIRTYARTHLRTNLRAYVHAYDAVETQRLPYVRTYVRKGLEPSRIRDISTYVRTYVRTYVSDCLGAVRNHWDERTYVIGLWPLKNNKSDSLILYAGNKMSLPFRGPPLVGFPLYC